MNCPRCGKEINAVGIYYCTACGASLSSQDPTALLPKGTNDSGSQARIENAKTLVGLVLDGKYKLNRTLGAGGMGAVYSATRTHIGDEVAVKILHPERTADYSAADRFRREAQIAARLKHPNAVSIHDFGISADGLMYLVMDLVSGQSLREIIKTQSPLAMSTVNDITNQVCAALEEAHKQGIIHRDIKPDNIIVTPTPNGLQVKVLDFGVAKMVGSTAGNLTQADTVMGTPRYMSPEQCMGEELDGRSDIYSYGIVLYEMLCGVVPFNSSTSTAVAVQHVTQQPAPLRMMNASVPPAVESVVMNTLQKQRDARPQTASAMAQRFSGAISGALNEPSIYSSGGYTVMGSTGGFRNSTAPDMPKVNTSATGNNVVKPLISPPKKSSKVPLVIAGVAMMLIFIVGATALAVIFRDQLFGSSKPDPVPSPSPKPSPTPKEETADDKYNILREKLLSAKSSEARDELEQDLIYAEQKYPTDYRFPYDRAIIKSNQTNVHMESYKVMYEAARKAIQNGKAKDMLRDIERDRIILEKLKHGHENAEWGRLIEALEEENADELVLKGGHGHGHGGHKH